MPPILASALLLWLSPAARVRLAAAARTPEAVFLAIVVLGWWLSLGPSPQVLGRPLNLWSPYRLLYDLVPGYDGLRAPARFAMVVAFALAMLAGLATAYLGRARKGALVVAAACAAFLAETWPPAFPLNGVTPVKGFAPPEARVHRPERAPVVYRELTKTPVDAVVLEFPFGQPIYDVRSLYYSTVHWRRLVNGYSGFFPSHYSRAIAMISAGARGDDVAWQALDALGVTHVIVHEGAYLDDEGARVVEWLRGRGAVEVFRDGRDVLLVRPQ